MGNWIKTINIKGPIDRYNSGPMTNKRSRQCSVEIADILALHPEVFHFAGRFRKARTENGCNKALAGLYDYCDAHHIWLGL
ncbi:MAG: hypothetical protein WC390_10080 [Sulfurimonas sp.]